jgi:hypothetical protein
LSAADAASRANINERARTPVIATSSTFIRALMQHRAYHLADYR